MSSTQSLATSNFQSVINDKKSLPRSRICTVCGDKPRGMNYGAMSCLSCKVFFRRQAFHAKAAYSCQFDGRCEVNMRTRKVCKLCRFAKCLAVGMTTDLIRKEDVYKRKPSSTKQSNKMQVSKFEYVPSLPRLNLLRDDKSLLTTSQWTLLSNVVHAYDRFNPNSTYNCISKAFSLSSDETRFDAASILKVASLAFISLQSFISATPDFQVLSLNEQQSLLKRNLHGMGPFAASVAFRDTNFFENPKCFNGFVEFYGSETGVQVVNVINQLDVDSTLLSFLMLIICFSSNCFIVNIDQNMPHDSFLFGTFRLFGSQNVYVDVLWKYMLYRYGYHETVLRFARLIKCALDKIKQTSSLYISNENHNNLIDGVVKQAKQSLIISQNEPTALWGKTLKSN